MADHRQTIDRRSLQAAAVDRRHVACDGLGVLEKIGNLQKLEKMRRP
jgi:hypothetical protein